MASKLIGEVVAASGEYNAQDGTKKMGYIKLGAAFQDERGEVFMRLEALPIPQNGKDGKPAIWLRIRAPKEQQQPQQQYQQQPQYRQEAPPVSQNGHKAQDAFSPNQKNQEDDGMPF